MCVVGISLKGTDRVETKEYKETNVIDIQYKGKSEG